MENDMLPKLELKHYMQPHPVTVAPGRTVYEAAQIITEHKVSGAVVVDENHRILGMLSELDCLRVLLAGLYNDEGHGAAIVGEVMTTSVEVQDPNDDIINVANSMMDHKHRRRPVVQHGRLIGQVTCRQILTIMAQQGLHR
jgi:CBS domain-containing protein